MSATGEFGKVAVFCGGTSREREISLQSGTAVTQGLEDAGIEVDMVDTSGVAIDFQAYDRVFIALHGRDGEDGKMQAILDYYRVPYTGSGVAASSVSMNKWYTKSVWQSLGIRTPRYHIVARDADFGTVSMDPPVYVKPVNEGSSIGISHVTDLSSLQSAVSKALDYDEFVLIEEEIKGKEYTFSFIEGQHDMPLIRLEPAGDFYDYEAKYLRDDTGYIVAPELPESLETLCVSMAKKAHQAIGMRGWGRVDFIIDEHDVPWFIEINSVPGMTSHSLVPMAASAIGLDFSQTCMAILRNALHG
jgi:D-alanine-D-alanine ligase